LYRQNPSVLGKVLDKTILESDPAAGGIRRNSLFGKSGQQRSDKVVIKPLEAANFGPSKPHRVQTVCFAITCHENNMNPTLSKKASDISPKGILGDQLIRREPVSVLRRQEERAMLHKIIVKLVENDQWRPWGFLFDSS
jgi:hypothetical protein